LNHSPYTFSPNIATRPVHQRELHQKGR